MLDILPGLLYYCDTVGDWTVLLALAHTGLELAALLGREAEMPPMLGTIAWVQSQRGLHDEAEAALHRALAITRTTGDRAWEVETLSRLSQTARRRGDAAGATTFYAEAYALVDGLAEPLATYMRADLEYERGKISRDQGDYHEALRLFQGARSVFSIDDENPTFNEERAWGVLGNVAHALAHLGEEAEAERLFRQSLDFFRRSGGRGYTTTLLVQLAALEARQGNRASALAHASEALELSQRLGMVQERQLAEAVLQELKSQISGETTHE